MPSGRTHDRITLWLIPLIVLFSYLLTNDGELTLLAAGGFFFSGLMFGPDLDIYSLQFKRWGILRYLWIPYQKGLNHRSFWSHGFLIGTIIRLIYLVVGLFIISSLIVAVLQLMIGFDWNWQQFMIKYFDLITQKYPQEAIALLIGLELGAMSHYLSDWLGSTRKKYAPKTNKAKNKRKKVLKK